MKKRHLFVSISLLISALCISAPGFADGNQTTGHGPNQDHMCQGGHNCNEDGGGTTGPINTESGANSRSYSDSDSEALSNADSESYAAGGDASASTGDLSASNVTDVAGGDVDVQTGAVTVDGDTAVTTISYDFPAEAARVLTNECQDGSAAQSKNFGINVTKMNPVCLYLMGAKAKFMVGSMMRCEPDSIRGSKAIVPAPTVTECERIQRRYFDEGMALVDNGMALIGRQGFVKKIWRKIW